jgi:ubiquinone/menaquinone biosynthesis C-methylase UbiE
MKTLKKKLTQYKAVKQYQKGNPDDNKDYPSLEIVRLEKFFFKSKPGKILDYAIGGGCNAFHFIKKKYDLVGIDTNPSLKKLLSKVAKEKRLKMPKFKVLRANSKRLPFKDNYFDYVYALSILSLLGDRSKILSLLSEFKRILKYDGKIILDINDHNSEFSANKRQIKKNVFVSNVNGNDVRTYCCKNISEFEDLVKPYFKIKDKGFSSFKIFKRQIKEFIICAENTL